MDMESSIAMVDSARLGHGYYLQICFRNVCQPAFYREMRNLDGTLNTA